VSAIIQKYNALPRAVKWLAYLGVILVAYFGVVMPLLKVSDSLNSQAARLRLAIADGNELRSDVGAGGDLRNGVRLYGMPDRPSDGKVSPESFSRVVNGILDAHNVVGNVNERRTRLTGDQAASLGPGNFDRMIIDITFESDPETVIAVLSDLERAKEVTAVSRVRIDKGNSRDEDQQKLRAAMSPEAWVAAGAGGSPAPSTTPEVTP